MVTPGTPDNEKERLKALKDYRILDTLPEQAYNDLANIAAQICGVPIALISFIDESRQWIKAGHGIPSVIRELPRAYSCCAHTILSPLELTEVPDISLDKRFSDNVLTTHEPHIQYYAGATLVNDQGYALGTISVMDHKPNKLSTAQRQSLLALSRQVIALLELHLERQAPNGNKTRLQELAESIGDGIYDLDLQGNFTYVNPALTTLTGYTEAELLSKAYYDLVHPDYMDDLSKFYYEQIKSGKDSSYYEFPIVSKSGETIWLGQTVKVFFKDGRVERVGAVAKDVTELKRVQKELQSSEKLYRLLSENSANLVCLQNPDGRFTYASPALSEITGLSHSEFLELNPAKLCHPDDMHRVISDFQEVLKGKVMLSQYRFMHKDGHYVWLESIARPILDKQGKVLNIQTSSRDISERKQSEMLIKREEANLKALIENSADIILSIDRSYRYIAFNSHFKRMVKEQMNIDLNIGDEVVSQRLPGKANDYWKQLYDRAFEGEHFIEQIPGIAHKDHFYECSFNPIVEEDNGTVIGVSVFARDTTDRVKTEMREKRFRQGLTLLNDLSSNFDISYANLIEKALQEVCLFFDMELAVLSNIDGDNYFIRYAIDASGNKPFKKNKRLDIKQTFCEITRQSHQIVAIDHAAESEYNQHPCHLNMKMESYLGSPVSIGTEPYGALCLSSKQPRSVPFDSYDKEFFEVFAKWIGAILERRKYEKLLVQSREEALEASHVKAEFLSTMSHEIRTPLNAIIGMTHILMQDDPKKSQIDNLNVLKFSGENLLALVNDVLDINKIEAGKLLLEASDFNLRQLLERSTNALVYSLEEKGLASEVHYDPKLPEVVIGDSVRLAQVVNNLMTNAIKFTSEGKVGIRAENRGMENGKVKVYIEVKDSGIGMTPDELAVVFERFTQATTSTTRKYGGTGLGLTIVKGLLELMNSSIQVESEPGEGSKFFFELLLPVSEIQDSTGPVFGHDLNQLAIKNIHVLLVEDNKVNQLVAQKFLNNWGISVTVAQNGEEALELIQKQAFNLVLMDLQMPKMDGYQATKAIRSLGIDVPILALTASVRIGQKNRAIEVGMNDFLVKPLTPTDLYAKISRFISTEDIGQLSQKAENTDEVMEPEFKALREMFQGDDEFKAEVIPLYIKNIQSIKTHLPRNIAAEDLKAADRLRHKMLTTLHTLEANQIKSLIDDGINLIGREFTEEKLEGYTQQLASACDDMEVRLNRFLGQS